MELVPTLCPLWTWFMEAVNDTKRLNKHSFIYVGSTHTRTRCRVLELGICTDSKWIRHTQNCNWQFKLAAEILHCEATQGFG